MPKSEAAGYPTQREAFTEKWKCDIIICLSLLRQIVFGMKAVRRHALRILGG